MSKKTNILTMTYIGFLALIFLSSALGGILSAVVYFAAFVLPLAISLWFCKNEGREEKSYLTIDKASFKKTLPVIFPTVSLIIIVSVLTSVIIYVTTGRTNSVDVGNSFVPALLRHALLPAILEEALFRYLPLRLLAPHSRRGAVIISAFFFALVHHDLFSIPYAFIAGVVFMAVDLAVDSIIPSVIIHFINNALSVGLLVFGDNPAFAPTIYTILAVLTLISAILIYRKREVYRDMLSSAFDKGEGVKITTEMILFAGLALTIAVISLL